ncbi:MAG TPA: hypothetical protein GXX46_00635 [Peptococcaceae bacterium]|nr:hypothetical protein [Peptococcaceae bacterium]
MGQEDGSFGKKGRLFCPIFCLGRMKRLRISTPMLETVARMIRAIETNYDKLVY